MPRTRRKARRRLGIRSQVTFAATLVVAAALALSGIALILLVQQSLVGSLDAAATARARDVASLANAGSLPTIIPNGGEESSLVQIVDSSGTIVASTQNVAGERAILSSPPQPGAPVARTISQSSVGAGEFRVIAVPVTLSSGPGWIYVATSLAQTAAAIRSLILLVSTGLPLIVLVVAWTVWRAVGQVLKPVDAIRQRASTIGAENLSQRVPVPATGDEIARLAVTMNEMLHRLDAAATRQSRFVGDASHELKSPLTALRAQVEVALAHPDPEGPAPVLTTVRDQATRMSVLIDDLLFLAKSTEVAAPLDTLVDLDELVLQEAHRVRELGSTVVEIVSISAARVVGSHRDLARMLRNLGDNAHDHARSRIAFSLATDGGEATITVADDGPGIPVESRERVFERFWRLDDSRARNSTGGGSGLGLAIARQIADGHHGSLTIEDPHPGDSGIVFVIRLPLATG